MRRSHGDRREHFWIPDEEVIQVDFKPTGRDKPRNVTYSDHGSKLSLGLQSIADRVKANQDSLSDEDIVVFQVTLPDGEKLDNSQRTKILDDNYLTINVVKDARHAIVTTSKQRFQRLRNRVEEYKKSGKFATFQYLSDFNPCIGSDKQTNSLREKAIDARDRQEVDVQLLLLPGLDRRLYQRVLRRLQNRVELEHGRLMEDPYFLSDGTPVVRTTIPTFALQSLSEDESVYRIEETNFFSTGADESPLDYFQQKIELDSTVELSRLPIIAILDSGVSLPDDMGDLIVDRWIPSDCTGCDLRHGTKVAGKAIFGHIGEFENGDLLLPRARVIDCQIIDNTIAESILIRRIQDCVVRFKDVASIFNLSTNSSRPIDGDVISIIGYELDNLMKIYGVQFVISVGNHLLWRTYDSLEEIIEDDDSQIAAPADSMLAISVGAVVGAEHNQSISRRNDIAPYSRIGPGFGGFRKPDICAFGATVIVDRSGETIPYDNYSVVIDRGGVLDREPGTSFAAPIVSGDLAEITANVPYNDILLGKCLLLHGAQALWDAEQISEDEAEDFANLYGRGLSVPEVSMYSSPHRVTFLRTGELNRTTKERVKFYMPSILAALPGRNVAKVTVTCVSRPPIDRTKGTEYLGAYLSASLHKSANDGAHLPSVNPKIKEGRKKWDTCYHFNRTFTNFEAGDWQVWLQLFSRWEFTDDARVPYAVAVSIEDLTRTQDIYSAVQVETAGRFQQVNTMRVSLKM